MNFNFLISSLFILALCFTAEARDLTTDIKTKKCLYEFYTKENEHFDGLDEIKHGEFKIISGSSELISGNYWHDKKEGAWLSLYENGARKLKEHFKDGLKEGPATAWYPGGQVKYTNSYMQNLKHGLAKSYFENGKLKASGNWIEGSEEGDFFTWHANGEMASKKQFAIGVLNGNHTVWDNQGRVLSNKIYYYGRELRLLVKQEKYASSNMKLAYGYYINAQQKEVKHGKYQKWFPNGEIWLECLYKHDELHGKWQYGKKDGLHCRIEHYSQGRKHGTFEWFHQGQLTRMEIWSNGTKVHENLHP
ncbi:MAG: toxin-antitoxin system YwqK family antitoxin [Planctomycetes bacterium]|nr:toxin-antitoxin system YwqK family antitoxin [Planctomycetota bacterium]